MSQDPNIWAADTGATTHSTRYQQGLKNLKKVEEGSGIMTAKGVADTTIQGNLSGVIHNKNGVEQLRAMLTNVQASKDGHFNLFSIYQNAM